MSKTTPVTPLVALVVGRFMLPHEGHLKLIRTAITALTLAFNEQRTTEPRLVVLLGSAFHARTPKNPFTSGERKNMILAALTPQERELVSFIAVRDYHDDERWARIVHRKVTELVGTEAQVQVYGHFKDASSSYLNDCFHRWEVVSVEKQGDFDATTLRAMLFSGGADHAITLSAMEDSVPKGVLEYLKVWMQKSCYLSLQEEFDVLRTERNKYGEGPFVAGDGIYRTKTHVLLVERKFHPGKGLLAIPGGFLESARRETPRQCAEREGAEETSLGVLKSDLKMAFKSSEVFAHPDRSVRGNVISHAFFYDLNCDSLPEVAGGDDAKVADWCPITELARMEDRFFDDHFLVLDHFLGILGEND